MVSVSHSGKHRRRPRFHWVAWVAKALHCAVRVTCSCSPTPADRRGPLLKIIRGAVCMRGHQKHMAVDTLLYEFDMLRHCAETVDGLWASRMLSLG